MFFGRDNGSARFRRPGTAGRGTVAGEKNARSPRDGPGRSGRELRSVPGMHLGCGICGLVCGRKKRLENIFLAYFSSASARAAPVRTTYTAQRQGILKLAWSLLCPEATAFSCCETARRVTSFAAVRRADCFLPDVAAGIMVAVAQRRRLRLLPDPLFRGCRPGETTVEWGKKHHEREELTGSQRTD